MVKAYLRYEHAARYGVVASSGCNVSIDREGRTLYCGSLEDVNGWSIRQGVLVRATQRICSLRRRLRVVPHRRAVRPCVQPGFCAIPSFWQAFFWAVLHRAFQGEHGVVTKCYRLLFLQ